MYYNSTEIVFLQIDRVQEFYTDVDPERHQITTAMLYVSGNRFAVSNIIELSS